MSTAFPRRNAAAAPSIGAAEDLSLDTLSGLLRRWLQGRARPDVLLVDPDGPGTLPLADALVHLRDTTAPLGAACARQVGLPDDATIAEAAHKLLFARFHRDGPRCRSFRSASYYLRGLARIGATDVVPDLVTRPASSAVAGGRGARRTERERDDQPSLVHDRSPDREMADQSSGQ